MGPSVRRLYVQGNEVNGAGINSSFAVAAGHRRPRDRLSRSAGRSPSARRTPSRPRSESEYKSDIFGERGILLGAVHGIVESLYRRFVSQGMSQEDAFRNSAESITGPISQDHLAPGHHRASTSGSTPTARRASSAAYAATYPAAREILAEIYDEVSSGNEIRSVVMAGERLKRYPMGKIDGTEMWKVGENVRAERVEDEIPLNPFTAGVYIATMMAQIDVLDENGHPLLGDRERVGHRGGRLAQPLHARPRRRLHGRQLLDHGAPRLPQVGAALRLRAHGAVATSRSTRSSRSTTTSWPPFKDHEIHHVLAECAKLRPSVDIFVE